MIAARRLQRSFADGLIAEQTHDLWEPWMRQADRALADERLLQTIQLELSKRCRKSKTRGRPGTTAEVVLRMLLLKHVRGWSYEETTREVRANLVYREFTGVGGGKVPDDKTMGRITRQLGPEAIEQLHRRTVEIAVEKKIIKGAKLRVDTTVVETNIHYPTDSTLMGDGVPGDYEHAITEIQAKGAPVSCWYNLALKSDGLYAVDVKWTHNARRMIEAKEYRYYSPYFSIEYRDDKSVVVEIINVALTNNPATKKQRPLVSAWSRGKRSFTIRPGSMESYRWCVRFHRCRIRLFTP